MKIDPKMIEFHNGSLTYQPTCVIYKGKEFKAPIDILVIMGYEYIYELVKSGDWKK